MDSASHLVIRDGSASGHALTASASNLLFGLLSLLFVGLGLIGVLCVLHRRRAATTAPNPLLPTHHKTSNHRRLTIIAMPYAGKTDPTHVTDEKRNLIENSSSPPDSPVPEIRITFPEEEDPSGNRKSGRVVLVRFGDSGSVGMEPVAQDPSPPYQSNDRDRFHSLDLDRIGGLKEKSEPRR